MTIKLAVDNSNVAAFPKHNPQIIPSIARTFADKVEDGEFGDVSRAVLLLETDFGVLKFHWGEHVSHFEALGIMQLAITEASLTAIADMAGDDED